MSGSKNNIFSSSGRQIVPNSEKSKRLLKAEKVFEAGEKKIKDKKRKERKKKGNVFTKKVKRAGKKLLNSRIRIR